MLFTLLKTVLLVCPNCVTVKSMKLCTPALWNLILFDPVIKSAPSGLPTASVIPKPASVVGLPVMSAHALEPPPPPPPATATPPCVAPSPNRSVLLDISTISDPVGNTPLLVDVLVST